MIEVFGDIWEYYNYGYWIVVPTNGFVTRKGEAVMGRGLALDTKKKFPEFSKELGERLGDYGNEVFTFMKYHLITFPVKRWYWEKASLELIEKSAKSLQTIFSINLMGIKTPVYLPRVGCGNGKLYWVDVKPILERYLDDRFIVVSLNKERP